MRGGDLVRVKGRDNMVQALTVMIGTPFGSDPMNVGYGFDTAAVFTMANTVRGIKDVIRLNIIKSLSADDRIVSIGDVVFDDEAGFAGLAPEIAGNQSLAASKRSRVWHAVAVFATREGAGARVAISGAAP
jgi:hypothetical protein